MATVSTTAAKSPLGAAALRPVAVALAIAALLTVARLSATVDSDVAWQLWIAGRIHAGAQLYRDIVEVNPPLWFWMALPVDRAATLLGVASEAVLIVIMGLATGLSLVATDALVRHIEPSRRTLFLGYAAVLLIGGSWMHVGQREQLVLIASLPYAALIAARRSGASVSSNLSLVIGVAAALGFALKHYFLIVPVLLELWLVAGRGKGWRWQRPEIAGVVVVGVAYACAILLFAPDYLTRIVPLVRLSYGQLGAPGLRHLFGLPVLLSALIMLIIVAHRKALKNAKVASALLVAACGFATVYFIQAKGWTYHAIPLVGCASLALASLLAELPILPAWSRVAAPAILALPLLFSIQETRNPVNPSPELERAISGLQPGTAVGFLAVESAIPWSVTLQHGFRYPSRYMSYWMLNAVVANERRAHPDVRLIQLGRQIVSETVDDFTCLSPQRIVVARPAPGGQDFDILPFFLRDPRFAALLSHYRGNRGAAIETYDLASPLPPPTTACRAGM